MNRILLAVVLAPLMTLAVSCVNGDGQATERKTGSATVEECRGAITRGPRDARKIAFCFTAHSYGEGAETILDTLKEKKGRASFFLTGDFLANTNFAGIVQRMLAEGHYVGPHSDKHLLYCSWEPSRKMLVSREEFARDLEANVAKIRGHIATAKQNGLVPRNIKPVSYFLPPYEHYNEEIARWTREMGMVLVNFTPGTRSNSDYTGEADKNFVPTQVIYDSIVTKERNDSDGLNGFLLLLHLGAGPGRADKFHVRFAELCAFLAQEGYQFVRVDEILKGWYRAQGNLTR